MAYIHCLTLENYLNKFMKYTIHGYSQEKSIENGLDYLDLGILRWIQDFYPAMKKTIFQNKEYGWFSYSYFLNELPIIGKIGRAHV